jgi:hypothetical protein
MTTQVLPLEPGSSRLKVFIHKESGIRIVGNEDLAVRFKSIPSTWFGDRSQIEYPVIEDPELKRLEVTVDAWVVGWLYDEDYPLYTEKLEDVSKLFSLVEEMGGLTNVEVCVSLEYLNKTLETRN